ncbi:MAG: AI-2E family transporter [Deltaproteobacteria bacterium]|jgi:predicted PurR-regulated permease PerM|nr:AI-2E family transporter [Deltaproteobacteria bacterium]
MSFNISEFARVNRVILIWTAFFGLLYLLRNLFGLVFTTFIMCFVAHGITRRLTQLTRWNRRVVVIVTYFLFLGTVVVFISFGLPRILSEAKLFSEQLPKSLDYIDSRIDEWIQDYPILTNSLEKVKEALTLEAIVTQSWDWGRSIIAKAWHYVSWFFLGILFSFLIVFDLPELIRKFRSLRFTRLHIIYDETVSSVIEFGKVVGENFRAQIYISFLNTSLTFIGLTIIGTGTTALLALLVFCFGLIPVLGVLISSVPIALVAINVGGLQMFFEVIGLIAIIHCVEAYILNPRIVSVFLRTNPVITLMILYIAHSIMGMWGMFLGVPISVYIYRQILNNQQKVNGKTMVMPEFLGTPQEAVNQAESQTTLMPVNSPADSSGTSSDDPQSES